MNKRYIFPLSIVIAGAIISGSLLISRDIAFLSDSEPGEAFIQTPSSDDNLLGNPDAPIVFVEYSDTECPFCKQFRSEMKRVMSHYGERGDVAWVYRHLPLINETSLRDALALECVAAEGEAVQFWSYLRRLYENKPSVAEGDMALDLVAHLAHEEGLDGTAIRECAEDGIFLERVEEQSREALAAGAHRTPFTAILLKDPLSEHKKELLRQAVVDLPANAVTIPHEKNMILLNGSIPSPFLESMIEALL